MDILARHHALKQNRPYLRLFALVDGLGFEQLHGEPLTRSASRFALFDGTPDQALAAAGPWLVDCEHDEALRDTLLASQRARPHVSWPMAEMSIDGLSQLFQLRLDASLPDGSTALLRFYDPRVLKSLALALTASQREAFFGPIIEWHFVVDDQSLRIGREDA